jgi:hypothetical protein
MRVTITQTSKQSTSLSLTWNIMAQRFASTAITELSVPSLQRSGSMEQHSPTISPRVAHRKARRSWTKMQHVLCIVHASLLIGTVLVLASVSRYMERALPRELLLQLDTTSLRIRQRTFPRIIACWQQEEPVDSLLERPSSLSSSSSVRCQSLLQAVAVFRTTVDHPYILPTQRTDRTTATLASEPDITRFYSDPNVSSADLPSMERRLYPQHEFDPHCEPMDPSWQSTFHPQCNDVHAHDMWDGLVEENSLSLLSAKGYWRHAWKKRELFADGQRAGRDVTVWKTFK